MNLFFFNFFKTSVGKKMIMSTTGLCFCAFIAVHLFGNLMIYGGKNIFNSYVDHLHSLGFIINILEFGLLILGAFHVATGLTLFWQNRKARPMRYSKKKNAGGRTIGSMTMPHTGFLTLFFLVFHLMDFHFASLEGQTVFDIVVIFFAKTGHVITYVGAVIVVGIHISHGFWSAFQTLGLNHPKYMSAIKGLGIFFSLAVGTGFGFIPIFIAALNRLR